MAAPSPPAGEAPPPEAASSQQQGAGTPECCRRPLAGQPLAAAKPPRQPPPQLPLEMAASAPLALQTFGTAWPALTRCQMPCCCGRASRRPAAGPPAAPRRTAAGRSWRLGGRSASAPTSAASRRGGLQGCCAALHCYSAPRPCPTLCSSRSPTRSGTALTDASRDFTVAVDAAPLQPGTRFFYRFTCGKGKQQRCVRPALQAPGPELMHRRHPRPHPRCPAAARWG